MTRREALLLLIGQGRLALLWLRVRIGRPLPAMLTALLVQLDRAARTIHQEGRR
jgi:hypothetical protein